MKIAIYGLGYVGLTAAGCLTKQGHSVVGVDVNELKVDKANVGVSAIREPGLDDLLKQAVGKGLLTCTTNFGKGVNHCDMAIVCVGTPSGADGSHNMSDIAEVSRQIATSVDPTRKIPLTVVYRSTIRPGSVEELIQPIFKTFLAENYRAVSLVYNPEFLREAVAIEDFFDPPKIVIGTQDGKPNAHMDELNKGINARVFYTNYREAEFTKFVDNTFHAVKVTFANEIGRVCLALGISARTVHQIFVSDTKLNISPYYLRPGNPFGGSCLPKDIRALEYISLDVGAGAHLVGSLIRSNEAHKQYIFEHVSRGLTEGAEVLMLGLAFKLNSDDLRESANVDLARKFLRAGFKLSIYDPSLRPSDLIGQNLGYAYSNLPTFGDLLVSREVAVSKEFDLVVDTNGTSKNMHVRTAKLHDINTLT